MIVVVAILIALPLLLITRNAILPLKPVVVPSLLTVFAVLLYALFDARVIIGIHPAPDITSSSR